MTVTYTLEIDFVTPLLGTPATWTDVTTYVRGFNTRRGRSHELGKMQAGEASVTLDNRDRRFDPSNTAGPYYPNVVPMRHMRIRATEGSTYDLFRGFVEDWGQQWSGPAAATMGDAVCEVHLVDAFKVLNLMVLPSYPAEVVADEPVLYFPFDGGEAGTQTNQGTFADVVLGPAVPTPATFGIASPLAGGTLAISAGGWSAGMPGDSGVLPTDPTSLTAPFKHSWTVEAWVFRSSGGMDVAAISQPSAGSSAAYVEVTAANKIRVTVYPTAVTGTVTLATGWHHLAVSKSGSKADVYVDGVYSETISGLQTSYGVTGTGGAAAYQSYVYGTGGGLGQVAMYGSALSAERIAAHASRTLGYIVAGQTVDTVITAILDSIAWPAGLRTLAASTHTVARHLPAGNVLGELLTLAEETDGGVLFATGDGKLRFRSSDSLGSDTAAAASWGDSSAELKYSGLTLRYDDSDLYTEVRATSEGLADAVYSDPTAATTYGPRTLESDGGFLGTQNELNDRASGYLTRYKAPALRPETLVAIDKSDQPTRTAELFTSEIGRRVSVTRRPPGGGAAMVLTAIIEGVSYSPVEQMSQMRGTLNLVPALDATPWILGNATFGVLGSTTDLGY